MFPEGAVMFPEGAVMFPEGAVMFPEGAEKVPFPGIDVTALNTVDHSGNGTAGGIVGACIYSPAIQLRELFVGSIAETKVVSISGYRRWTWER